ncbi:hypothetical protein P6144_20290 [Sphingomonas sp. HITSZ_GF]|uniref:hypothetical protein n=1 Tax=Sphingomonas sp. HITSZ_GF TaxID=3037247 RepID=UPI00240D9075|nr:hypothetical protein [Sphingomonas sp. HITSZ_GF]MDG2536011.1 hypothetical protein [Sphingomonas sp. HITSZ_GF]
MDAQLGQLLGVPSFATRWFLPHYRPLRSGSWEIRTSSGVLAQGYWSPAVLVEELPALLRDGAVWMSLTPMEIESQEIGLALSRGHVVVMGMGMGWAAMAAALRDEVTRVTVVERDGDVLAIHRELDLFAQLPDAARAKLRVVQADALEWQADAPVDLLMPDIWLPLVSDGRVEEVRRMQANVGAEAIYFWGQEMEIARHARAAGRALDGRGIADTIAEFGLPLVGPTYPGHADIVATVAQRWMRDRWLPGTPQSE